jgi:hypothetical protein
MPLVPHPPSASRTQSESGIDVASGRLPSGGGGGRASDVRSFAIVQKQGLPTLNFGQLQQQTKRDLDQALAGGAVSQRGSTAAVATARARQYTAGGNTHVAGGEAAQGGGQSQHVTQNALGQAAQGGGAGAQPPRQYSSGGPQHAAFAQATTARPPQAPNAAGPPPVRRIVGNGGGSAVAVGAGGIMPHPPERKKSAEDTPERNKPEPAYPLTARVQPTQESKSVPQEAAQRHPMTARPSASTAEHDTPLVAQKYDEVSKASATGGSNVPLTPAAALKLYMNQMTLYEQGEILDYPQVLSAGPLAQKHPSYCYICVFNTAIHVVFRLFT